MSDGLLREILGNVSTLLTFNVSHPDAVKLSREYVFDSAGQAEYIPPEDFIRLKTGEALGKIGKSVFPLRTYLADQRPDFIRAKEVIERSRQNYGFFIREKASSQKTGSLKPAQKDHDLDPSEVF